MFFILFLFAAISFTVFLVLTKETKKNERSLHPPPGPKGLPFIGNLHQFDVKTPHIYLAKLAKIYGPILSLRLGRKPVIVVQSAKLAKEVLQTQDLNFCSRPDMVASRKLCYNGLDIAFSPYNYSQEMRKLCTASLFSSKKVQAFSPIRRDEVSKMIQKISSLSSASEIINLSEMLMSYATSNICRIAFGKRYGDDEESGRRKFYRILNEADALFLAFFFSDYFPSMSWLDKFTGQSSRLERAFKELDAFYDEIIEDHLNPEKTNSEQDDLVDILLGLMKEHSVTIDLTIEHIKAVLMNVIVAGTETTAVMVVWAMTELVRNPQVMKKVQEELRKAAQNKGCITEDDLPKLEYFKAVVKETFRLRPSAPLLLAREAQQKCTVEGYEILPKTMLFVNVWTIGRDSEIWKDPEIFMPERFLGSSIDLKGQNFELIPFGAGRKICPGLQLGLTNTELALANLLHSFDWELPSGMKKEDIDTDSIPGINMHKKIPLCLVAQKVSGVV